MAFLHQSARWAQWPCQSPAAHHSTRAPSTLKASAAIRAHIARPGVRRPIRAHTPVRCHRTDSDLGCLWSVTAWPTRALPGWPHRHTPCPPSERTLPRQSARCPITALAVLWQREVPHQNARCPVARTRCSVKTSAALMQSTASQRNTLVYFSVRCSNAVTNAASSAATSERMSPTAVVAS